MISFNIDASGNISGLLNNKNFIVSQNNPRYEEIKEAINKEDIVLLTSLLSRNIKYVITASGNISFTINGKAFNIIPENPKYNEIKEAVFADNAEKVLELTDVVTTIQTFSAGDVTIQGGQVFYNNEPIHHAVATKILMLKSKGFNFEPFRLFLQKLFRNPSFRARKELWRYLEAKHYAITPDGCFIGYKRVNDDWTDVHTGKILYEIGKPATHDRNLVDDDWGVDCSEGIHVGTLDYVHNFRPASGEGHIMIVKVDPKDVVTVPNEFTKMRVCECLPIGEYEGEIKTEVYEQPSSHVIPLDNQFNEDDEEEEDSVLFEDDDDDDEDDDFNNDDDM